MYESKSILSSKDDWYNCNNFVANSLPAQRHVSNSKNLKNDSFSSLEVSISSYDKPQDPTVDFIEHYRNIYSSPDNFIKRRVDYGRMKVSDDKLRQESERRNSFTKFPKILEHLTNPLAKSGFYHITDESDLDDKVKCIFCQGTLFSWKKTDVPDREHKKSFPTCPFILNLNVGNQPVQEKPEKLLHVDPDLKVEDRFVSYNVIKPDSISIYELSINLHGDCDWRERTFIPRWENLMYLALLGLFVQEKGSRYDISCYQCQKSTELLPGAENCVNEIFHKQNCSLITEVSQENQLKMKPAETSKSKKMKVCKIEYSITDEEIEARLDSQIANKITTLADRKKNIKSLIAQKLKRTGKDYESIVDLLYDLKIHELKDDESDRNSDDEDPCGNGLVYLFPSHSMSLVYAMRDQTCVVCMDNPSQVVYLPCGHFKTCRTCSNALKSCPVCRKLIERRVYDIQFHLH